MRKTTKLAGTKDMAKITQMETSTSTDVVILVENFPKGEKGIPTEVPARRWVGAILTAPPATAAPW